MCEKSKQFYLYKRKFKKKQSSLSRHGFYGFKQNQFPNKCANKIIVKNRMLYSESKNRSALMKMEFEKKLQ